MQSDSLAKIFENYWIIYFNTDRNLLISFDYMWL